MQGGVTCVQLRDVSTASQMAHRVSFGICSTSVLVFVGNTAPRRNYIIDAMYRLTPEVLEKEANYEVR